MAVPTSVTFYCRPPASKKNRRKLVKVRGRTISIPSAEATAAEAEIRAAWIEATRRIDGPLWTSEDCLLRVLYDVSREVLEVTVEPVGERPKGRTGRKRDLQGMLETICDALQGYAYENDNQVSSIHMIRRKR